MPWTSQAQLDRIEAKLDQLLASLAAAGVALVAPKIMPRTRGPLSQMVPARKRTAADVQIMNREARLERQQRDREQQASPRGASTGPSTPTNPSPTSPIPSPISGPSITPRPETSDTSAGPETPS